MDPRGPEWVAKLAPAGARQRFPTGASLFVEGDPAHAVLVIQAGEVKVVISSTSGREHVLDVLGPGDVLGELAALDGGARSASAVALSPVEVLAIPASTFREVAAGDNGILLSLLGEVIRRLRTSDQRQLEFGADALGRVCARLIEVADRQGSDEVVLPVNQSELAAWTGLSREAVVKALASLRRLGWIETDGRRVVLRQPDQVRQRAGA